MYGYIEHSLRLRKYYMKKITKQIKDTAHKVELSASEKSRMKSTVLEYAEMKPVYANPTERRGFTKFFIGIMIALFVFATGGSVTFAAQSSLPGDILYEAKLATEKIREVIILDEEKKIAWIASRAERRISESIALAQKNALTEPVARDLQKRFEGQMVRALERIDTLEKVRPVNAKRVRVDIQKNIAVAEKRLDAFSNEKEVPVVVQVQPVRDVAQVEEEVSMPLDTPPVAPVPPKEITSIADSVKEQKKAFDLREERYKKRNIQKVLPRSVIKKAPQLQISPKPIRKEVITPPAKEKQRIKNKPEETKEVTGKREIEAGRDASTEDKKPVLVSPSL